MGGAIILLLIFILGWLLSLWLIRRLFESQDGGQDDAETESEEPRHGDDDSVPATASWRRT